MPYLVTTNHEINDINDIDSIEIKKVENNGFIHSDDAIKNWILLVIKYNEDLLNKNFLLQKKHVMFDIK